MIKIKNSIMVSKFSKNLSSNFRKISIADRKPAALSAWRRLTNQLKNFHEDFHLESSRYCAVETLAPPCELVRFSEDATFDKIVEQTKKLLDFLSGLCDSGFSYRWYDSLNQLLFNSGASSRIEAEAIPEEFKIQDKPAEHPVYQQEPVRMVLENEFVVHKRLELETTAGTTVTTPSMLTTQSGRGPPNKLLAEPFFPRKNQKFIDFLYNFKKFLIIFQIKFKLFFYNLLI